MTDKDKKEVEETPRDPMVFTWVEGDIEIIEEGGSEEAVPQEVEQ